MARLDIGETITNSKSATTTFRRRRHARPRYRGVIGVSCFAFVASITLLVACASSPPPVQQQAQSSPQISQVASNSDKAPATGPAQIAPAQIAAVDEDANALETLWKTRTVATGGDPSSGFTLGPGDVLQISLPQIDHTKDRTVRVSEENTIALPLLGVINVSNMTEEDLRNDLSRRVSKYFYHPQVALFLRHTEGRQVAVSGAVKAPGRYMLASRSDTIMTMLSRAGGVTADAAPRIILIPAGSASSHMTLPPAGTRAQDPSADLPGVASANSGGDATSDPGVARVSQAQPAEADTSGTTRTSIDRVVISLSRPSDQHYLNLPAKAGDVILVPAAGQVTVQGWVDKPGSFPITNGMTALGAIASAGGALFTSSATLLREQENGVKSSIPLNLSMIKQGQESDPEVHGGDVVMVERSAAGALPYSLYTIVSKMGIGIPIPIP
jgi:protein involved in polysaccharide export with SLBB domain